MLDADFAEKSSDYFVDNILDFLRSSSYISIQQRRLYISIFDFYQAS